MVGKEMKGIVKDWYQHTLWVNDRDPKSPRRGHPSLILKTV